MDSDARLEVVPATADRFGDVRAVLAPRHPDAAACWCLSYRLPNAEYSSLPADERPARLQRYADDGAAPGVLLYVDGEIAAWCSVAPRASHHRLTRSRTIPPLDDRPVWSIVCLVVRAPFRGQGLALPLITGAVDYAREQGAPAVEAYPTDSDAGRVSAASAYVGTTRLFERAGFTRAAPTTSRSGGAPRWTMRRELESEPAER